MSTGEGQRSLFVLRGFFVLGFVDLNTLVKNLTLVGREGCEVAKTSLASMLCLLGMQPMGKASWTYSMIRFDSITINALTRARIAVSQRSLALCEFEPKGDGVLL